MKTPLRSVILAVALCSGPAAGLRGQTATPPVERVLEDVRFLASDSLQGRLTGTPQADTAAAYVARRFAQVGLQASPRGWFQDFVIARDAPSAVRAGIGGVTGRNVIGVLPGREPGLRNQIVVVGAHYDHLGLGRFGTLDPDSAGIIHNGADDNASGVAALMRIAGILAAAPPPRTVVFIAFSGEEEGLLGSSYYVRNPIFPMSSVVAMVNLDMVGRLRNDRLLVYGSATATEFPALLDSLNASAGFALHYQGDGHGPSDQSSFYDAGKPVLHLFTDLHEDYHRTGDDWWKVSGEGILRVADFTAAVVRAIATRPEPPTYVNLPPPPVTARTPAATPGYGAYLGTIPDMAGGTTGIRLSGVRSGSPADSAGLRRDDVIIRIGDQEVPDLQAMTDVLRSHRPGDVVEITFLRDGVEQKVKTRLGTRGA